MDLIEISFLIFVMELQIIYVLLKQNMVKYLEPIVMFPTKKLMMMMLNNIIKRIHILLSLAKIT